MSIAGPVVVLLQARFGILSLRTKHRGRPHACCLWYHGSKHLTVSGVPSMAVLALVLLAVWLLLVAGLPLSSSSGAPVPPASPASGTTATSPSSRPTRLAVFGQRPGPGLPTPAGLVHERPPRRRPGQRCARCRGRHPWRRHDAGHDLPHRQGCRELGFKGSSQRRLLLTGSTVARRGPRRVVSSRGSCGVGC
jgi:hypothetical protein